MRLLLLGVMLVVVGVVTAPAAAHEWECPLEWCNDGSNSVSGHEHKDSMVLAAGYDDAWGREGPDTLIGGSEADNLTGGPGDDFLVGGKGADVIEAGKGDDIIDVSGNDDRLDRVGCGEGYDRVYVPPAGSGTEVGYTNCELVRAVS